MCVESCRDGNFYRSMQECDQEIKFIFNELTPLLIYEMNIIQSRFGNFDKENFNDICIKGISSLPLL